MGAQHHAEPHSQDQQAEVLGPTPAHGTQLLAVLTRLNLSGLGCWLPDHRLWMDVGQRLLLVEQVVCRAVGAARLSEVLVRDDGGGSKITGVADWRQIVFGIDQPCRGGVSGCRLRGFTRPPPTCVMRLTGHGSQGKGNFVRIGDLSGAFAWQSALSPQNWPG